jgi:adenosylcobinamide-phosphate synthase
VLALNTPLLTVGALLVEAAFGYPAGLLRRAGHPVMWFGAAIAWLDGALNRGGAGRARGVVAVVVLLALAGLPAWAVQAALLHWLPHPVAMVAVAVLASSLLAQRSLWTHVRAVASGLQIGLAEGRDAVSHIVGRNPQSLDGAGVARAAIESLAENFSDGVVAPALWCALLGLPGIAMYKAINTADSMIGHRTPRHEAFGWAAARLDDVVNLPASRLSALLLAAASVSRAGPAMRAVRRDARRHRSPNAGWPEAAMAGALGLRLAGPRVYGAVLVDDAWMGDGSAGAGATDIHRALTVYRRACLGLIALLALVSL